MNKEIEEHFAEASEPVPVPFGHFGGLSSE